MRVELSISRAKRSQRPTLAWYLPSQQCETWLREILSWQVSDGLLRLAVIPTSSENPALRGLLVVLPPGQEICPSSWTIAYGRIGERYYLPVDAKLQPALNEAELIGHLRAEQGDFVFHPSAGQVHISKWYGVEDLIAVPTASHETWDFAQPGTHFCSELKSIQAVYPTATSAATVDEFLRKGAEDIGEVASEEKSQWERLLNEESEAIAQREARAAEQGTARTAWSRFAWPRIPWGRLPWAGILLFVALLLLMSSRMWNADRPPTADPTRPPSTSFRSVPRDSQHADLPSSSPPNEPTIWDSFMQLLPNLFTCLFVVILLLLAFFVLANAWPDRRGTPNSASQTRPHDFEPSSAVEPVAASSVVFHRQAGALSSALSGGFAAFGSMLFAPIGLLAASASKLASTTGARATGSSSAKSSDHAVSSLIDMLLRDPDRGLRFSIPLSKSGGWTNGGDVQGFGLFEHGLNFQFSAPSGSASGYIDSDRWHKLRQLYETLAQRELRLGRHRRAAFIYGTLLNDYRSAAKALESGQHWRDAALVYKEKLQRQSDAARCFENGSLWSEAIQIWEELKDFEKVGDLFRRMGEPEKALISYRQQTDRYVARHNIVQAIRLLTSKIHEPKEAIALVDEHWQTALLPEKCLEEGFRLRAQQGMQGETLAWIEALKRLDNTATHVKGIEASEASERERLSVVAVSALAGIKSFYPDPKISEESFDAVRVLSAHFAPSASAQNRRKLMNHVRSTCENDKYLGRDCGRYADGGDKTLQGTSLGPIRRLSETHLGGRWENVISVGPYFLAIGYDHEFRPTAGMGLAGTDEFSKVLIDERVVNVEAATIVSSSTTEAALFLDQPLKTAKPIRIPVTGTLPGCVIDVPVWLPETACGFSTADGVSVYLDETDSGMELRYRLDDASIGFKTVRAINRELYRIGYSVKQGAETFLRPIPMLLNDKKLWLPTELSLLEIDLGSDPEPYVVCEHEIEVEAAQFIRGFVGHGRSRGNLVVETCYDYSLFKLQESQFVRLSAPDSRVLAAGTTRGGAVIAVDAESITVWPGPNQASPIRVSYPSQHQNIEAVLTSRYRDRFVLFYRDGLMEEYEVKKC